jgi:hypothetical protein
MKRSSNSYLHEVDDAMKRIAVQKFILATLARQNVKIGSRDDKLWMGSRSLTCMNANGQCWIVWEMRDLGSCFHLPNTFHPRIINTSCGLSLLHIKSKLPALPAQGTQPPSDLLKPFQYPLRDFKVVLLHEGHMAIAMNSLLR